MYIKCYLLFVHNRIYYNVHVVCNILHQSLQDLSLFYNSHLSSFHFCLRVIDEKILAAFFLLCLQYQTFVSMKRSRNIEVVFTSKEFINLKYKWDISSSKCSIINFIILTNVKCYSQNCFENVINILLAGLQCTADIDE